MQNSVSREEVCARILDTVKEGYKVVAVVSAMGRFGDPYATDTLLELTDWEDDSKEIHLVKSCGELIASAVLTALLKTQDISCELMYGVDAGIYEKEGDILVELAAIKNQLQEVDVVLVPGFQYLTENGQFRTLGRGGSDFSALLYAQHLECQAIFFKDVSGVYYPPSSRRLAPSLTHAQLTECDVIQKRAAQYAALHQIPIEIRSYSHQSGGTIIRSPLPEIQ